MVPHFPHPSCAYATSRAAEGLQKSICICFVSRRPICGGRVQKAQPIETRWRMRERREAGGCVPLGCVLSAFCDLGAGDGLGWGQRATVKLRAVAFRGQRGRFLAASRAGRRAAWEASKNEVKHHGKHAPFSPSFLVDILHRPGRLPTAMARKGRAQLGKRARQGREGTRPAAAAVSTANR